MLFVAVAQPAQRLRRHCIGEALESRQLLTVVSDVAVLSFHTAPDELAAEIGDGLDTDTLRHDLNGDGVLDLIQPGDTVFIDQDLQLAQLKISYAASGSNDTWEQTFIFPGRVVDLDAGDINGDGHIDIAIGHRPQRGPLNGVSGGTSVLIGSESGFGPPLRISRVEPSRVAILPASLDQQGEITLGKIVEIRGEDQPATMIQWSDETILHVTDERVTGTHPTIVEDLDADGFSDVVSFVQNRNQIHVHVHASDTNAPITSEVGGTLSSPWNFITGDFNGDGTTDAFSWRFETTQTFLSNADFTFQAPLNGRLPDTTHTVFTADYDGDVGTRSFSETERCSWVLTKLTLASSRPEDGRYHVNPNWMRVLTPFSSRTSTEMVETTSSFGIEFTTAPTKASATPPFLTVITGSSNR